MNRNTLSRFSAVVGLLIFTLSTAQADIIQDPVGKRLEAQTNECNSLKKQAAEARANFGAYCKDEYKKDMRDQKKSSDATKKCAEDFDTCADMAENETSFSETMVTAVSKAKGFEIPSFGTATSKKCSKYTESEYASRLDKMETKLDTKKKDYKDSIEKNSKDEESYSEKSAKLQEDFVKQQEDKAKAELDSKEDQRNKQAAFDKQKQEYESKLRQLDSDIFKLQQQQALMTAQRGGEVNSYKAAIVKCKAEIREAAKKYNTNTAGNLNTASKGSGDKNRDLKDLWDACTDTALKNRISEAEKYRVAMEQVSHDIQDKTAEIATLRESLQKLQTMFSQAAQDDALHQQKQEEAFMKKQAQKIQQVQQLDSQMQNKRVENQKAIAEAKDAITVASNKLKDFENEEPIGDKSRSDITKELMKATSYDESAKTVCAEADTLAKKVESNSSSSSSSPGTR